MAGYRHGVFVFYLFLSCVFANAEPLHERPAPGARRSGISPDEFRAAKVERIFTSVFDRNTPGCNVTVDRDGVTVFERGYGSKVVPSLRPDSRNAEITPSTRMRIASISKPIVATAMMILRRRQLRSGKDLLDKKLGEIYPFMKGKPAFSEITVRHLLGHTSSLIKQLPDEFSLEASPDDLPLELQKLGRKVFVRLPGQKAIPRPGTHFEYSNINYMLLADILGRESGMDWKEFIRKEIFTPLGMKDSNIADARREQIFGRLARGHFAAGETFEEAALDPYVLRFYSGASTINSTASDLVRFSRAVDENKLLSREDWQLAFTASRPSLSDGGGFGLGWGVYPSRGERTRLRPDEMSYQSHDGEMDGFKGGLLRAQRSHPSCRLSVAVLCNYSMTVGKGPQFDPMAITYDIADIYCPPSR